MDFTNILDPDFPQIDRTRVRPSVQQVAVHEATRTVDETGKVVGTFTDTTWPTADMCELVIDQAVELCLADLPDYMPESTYPRILQAVAFRAACLIERGFYREQYEKGSSKSHEDDYDKLLASIEVVSGGAQAGRRVDTPMMRSTMAEYEPDYPLPPPRIMPKLPFIVDGSTGDEEGQV